MITALNPDGVLANPFYSQGIALTDTQRLVFISGQVSTDADGVLADGIAAQAERAINNVHAARDVHALRRHGLARGAGGDRGDRGGIAGPILRRIA